MTHPRRRAAIAPPPSPRPVRSGIVAATVVALLTSTLWAAPAQSLPTATAARDFPGPAVPGLPAGAADEADWAAVQQLVGAGVGRYTAPPNEGLVLSSGFNAGLLLGNGDVHVTSDARAGRQTLYIAKSDFWDGFGQGHFGRLDLRSNSAATPTATASPSIECNATCVIDGDPETRWISDDLVGDPPDPKWVNVEFPQPVTVDRWVVRHNGFEGRVAAYQENNTRDFALQASDDGQTWRDVDVVSGSSSELTDRQVAPTTAKLFRLSVTDGTQPGAASGKVFIRDLQLFGDGTNLTPPIPKGPDTAYLQEQDILNAEVRGAQTVAGEVLRTRTWIADDENLLVSEVWNDSGEPMELALDLKLPTRAGWPTSYGVNEDGSVWATRGTGSDITPNFVARMAASVRVLGASDVAASSTTERSTVTFTLPAGQRVEVVTSLQGEGTFANTLTRAGLAEATSARASAIDAAEIDRVHADHLAWWKDFWTRSYVSTGDSVLDAWYYGALYAVGAGNREGFFPTGAFSPWRASDTVGLGNRYYLNYNYQAQTFGMFAANRPELVANYFAPIIAEIPFQRRLTAVAGYEGVAFQRAVGPHNTTRPAPGPLPIAATKDYRRLPADQKSNGTYAAIPFIWHYEYTGDLDFFRETTYPFLKDLAAFWMDYLELDDSGHLVVKHTGVNEGGDDLNPTYDLGYIRMLFTALLEGSADLGVDADLRTQWQSTLDQLAPYPTGFMEGFDKEVLFLADEINNPIKGNALLNKDDQPINLEGTVFPADLYGLGDDPAFLELARNTLEYTDPFQPGDRGATLNGFPKTFAIAARIGWPAEDLLQKLRTAILSNFRGNLTFMQHGGGLESSGGIEALHSMFLQRNNDDRIRLFPTWPAERDASFTRLATKGGFEVSSSFTGGAVGETRITSRLGGELAVVDAWGGHASVMVQDGDRLVPARGVTRDGDHLVVDSEPGDTFVFAADSTAPTVTVKDGDEFTVSGEGGYEKVSFKLFDEGGIDRLTLNGVEKDLTNDTWSDLNGVVPGSFGAVLGANELTVYDAAGNPTTLEFTLVPAVPAWEASKTYRKGDTVRYDGAVFVAEWRTTNDRPGATARGPWMEQGVLQPEAGDGVRAWTASWIYTGGEVVAHDSHTYRAKWWTRDQEPGAAHGPWEDLGAY